MENVIKILPIIVVVLVVFLIREGLSFYRYVKYCKLHEAAKTGKIVKARRLLEEGHPVNAVDPNFGLTPLHFAVRNGHVEIARLLIENGADLTQPSTAGITPLDWTSAYLDPDQRAELLRGTAGEADTDAV
ncbi:ankyrin repeat domain-containing protein [Desulfosarcina sp.]|uniref:ankyrin repeat domain-containing protein n=1 Tax=Desulfosarcina sp. TaxID=2027861 RepID=UPI00356787F0